MPPPSTEQDLKRRARRRLIGAVALTLLAVIVLPLLLEDEPPPASSLAVHMAEEPLAVPEPVAQPIAAAEPEAAAPPEATESTQIPEPVESSLAATPETVKPEPTKPQAVKPIAKPQPPKPATTAADKPANTEQPASRSFVVQLAALSDPARANALKARAAQAGLPAYTDTLGKLTRVRVGPYATREAAVAAAVKLAENGMSGQIVEK
jgi:DedD protein